LLRKCLLLKRLLLELELFWLLWESLLLHLLLYRLLLEYLLLVWLDVLLLLGWVGGLELLWCVAPDCPRVDGCWHPGPWHGSRD
jgi:hypothetical protein